MNCTRCKVKMKPGQAMTSTWRGMPDFSGDRYPVTMSPGGPGRVVRCWKCPKCGHSISFGGKK